MSRRAEDFSVSSIGRRFRLMRARASGGWRVRLRQDDDGARADGVDVRRRAGFGFGPLRRARAGWPRRRWITSIARRSHRHDLPGADDGAQSAASGWRASRRTADAASGLEQARGAGARSPVARSCAIGRAGARGAILSVPAFRRRTAARDDRHGDRLHAAPGHCRRADHRARRHGAGAHPRPYRRPQVEIEDGDPARESRSRGDCRTLRPCHRHVCGHDHGERAGRSGVASAQEPIHAGAARSPSATRRAARRSAEDHPGRPPVAHEHQVGCPFAGRCALTIDICRTLAPPEVAFGAGHVSRCHRAGEVGFAG